MNNYDVIWILENKYEINFLGKTSLKTMRKNFLILISNILYYVQQLQRFCLIKKKKNNQKTPASQTILEVK